MHGQEQLHLEEDLEVDGTLLPTEDYFPLNKQGCSTSGVHQKLEAPKDGSLTCLAVHFGGAKQPECQVRIHVLTPPPRGLSPGHPEFQFRQCARSSSGTVTYSAVHACKVASRMPVVCRWVCLKRNDEYNEGTLCLR